MPRLEENKSSCDEREFDFLNWFSYDSEEIESPTPRFDHQAGEFTILKWNKNGLICKEIKTKTSKKINLSMI